MEQLPISATLGYAIGFYLLAIFSNAAFSFFGNERLALVPSAVMALGWVAQTFLLLGLWAHGGIGHPPVAGPHEVWLFLSWAIVTVQLFVDIRYSIPWSGVLSIPLAIAAIAMAWIQPDQRIQNLAPMFDSPFWVLHSVTALGSTALLLIAGLLAVFQLIRDGIRIDSMQFVFSLVAAMTLGFAYGIAPERLSDWSTWTLVVLAVFCLHIVAGFVPGGRKIAAGWVGVRDERLEFPRVVTRWIFVVAASLLTLLCLILLFGPGHTGLLFRENPYRIISLVLAAWMGKLLLVLTHFRPRLEEKLPTVVKIDASAYHLLILGFSLLCLSLFFGAIWTELAWGRVWVWDIGRIGSLILWLYYSIYLHTRFIPNPSGRFTALTGVFGVVLVLFVFTSLNGLHGG